MTTIRESLESGGPQPAMSMFAIFPTGEAPHDIEISGIPHKLRIHVMENERGQNHVCEFDIVFDQLPLDIDEVILGCFADVRRKGARIAWFAFEGSFHYDFLLSQDVASQIYAIMSGDGVSIATDADITSDEWAMRVAKAGLEARDEWDASRS